MTLKVTPAKASQMTQWSSPDLSGPWGPRPLGDMLPCGEVAGSRTGVCVKKWGSALTEGAWGTTLALAH